MNCPCCCQACDRGYVRDAVWDEDIGRAVPADRLCAHRRPGARLCARCARSGCDAALGANCA
ncbi:hypothetical protein [Streptomyces tendae]|uniref:hypothetical protein n=1 Tax=Streptomyces tendae TaxID=1932 RepID=UPI003EB9FB18